MIKLRMPLGGAIYVNPDHVQSASEDGETTYLKMVGGEAISVIGSLDEVAARLNGEYVVNVEGESEAARRLRHGAEYPYDDGRAQGWHYAAARGVIADLTDRRGIKYGFDDIDDETCNEIVRSLADIIRLAMSSLGTSDCPP